MKETRKKIKKIKRREGIVHSASEVTVWDLGKRGKFLPLSSSLACS